MAYIYNDEDNVPMRDDAWDETDRIMKYTTYTSRAEMEAHDKGIPFDDPEPDNGCWNCIEFDGDRCHKEWNNNDEDYYDPDRDDKQPTDHCSDWERDESITSWGETYGGNDP